MFKNEMKMKGLITIQVKDKNGEFKNLFKRNALGLMLQKMGLKVPSFFLFGKLVKELVIQNTITNTGKGETTNLMGNVSTPTAFTYLAVGTGTNAAAATDTALQTETTDSGLARASATVTRQTTTTTNDTLQLYKQWSVTGTKAITECGIFNAASTGIILGRQVFSAVNLANGDTFAITYKVQLT